MITKSKRTEWWWRRAAVGASLFALLSNSFNAFGQNHTANKADHLKTATPIKHVVVLIDENRSFDHLFATYVPRKGETVSNLLSKGIINADGTPGPNFSIVQQFQAVAPFQTEYFISLSSDQKAPYSILPAPTLNFAPTTPLRSRHAHQLAGCSRTLLGTSKLESADNRRRDRLFADVHSARSRYARAKL